MSNNTTSALYPWLVDSFEHLSNLYVHHKLPSVILLNGPYGFGKTELAFKVASLLNSKNRDGNPSTDFNLDLNFLGIDNSRNNKIKIDDIRKMITSSHHTDLYKIKKYHIIINIENLTESAANALLKSLEENNNTYFIFTTSQINQVLPTILSRCYKLNLMGNNNHNNIFDIQSNWLKVNGITKDSDRALLLKMANFAPLQALKYYNNQYLDKLKSLEIILSGLNNKLVTSMGYIKELFQYSDNSKIKFNLDDFLNVMYYIVTKNNMKDATCLILSYTKNLESGVALDSDNILYKLLLVISSEKIN